MSTNRSGTFWQQANFTVAILISFWLFSTLGFAETQSENAQPLDIIKTYLKALQAHDFRTAYKYLSSSDRNVRDEKSYLHSEAPFRGFALELAKKLAEPMQVWVVDEKVGPASAHYDVGYRVPAADEIAPQLLDWNADKLNALPAGEQQRLFEAVQKLEQREKIITIEGREKFDLVLEKSGWRIFLDWRSRTPIRFKAALANADLLQVNFLRNDFLIKTDEPFQIDFTVKNRSNRDLIIKLNHRFEPRRLAGNVDMIACGSLSPLRLRQQEVRELSSNYLLRGPIEKSARLSIIYDFAVAPAVAERKKTP